MWLILALLVDWNTYGPSRTIESLACFIRNAGRCASSLLFVVMKHEPESVCEPRIVGHVPRPWVSVTRENCSIFPSPARGKHGRIGWRDLLPRQLSDQRPSTIFNQGHHIYHLQLTPRPQVLALWNPFSNQKIPLPHISPT